MSTESTEQFANFDYSTLNMADAPEDFMNFIESNVQSFEEATNSLVTSLKSGLEEKLNSWIAEDPAKVESVKEMFSDLNAKAEEMQRRKESIQSKWRTHVTSVLDDFKEDIRHGSGLERFAALLTLVDNVMDGLDDFSASVAREHNEFDALDRVWRVAEVAALTTVYGIARAGAKAASVVGNTLKKISDGEGVWSSFISSIKEVFAWVAKKALRIVSGKDAGKAVEDFHAALGITKYTDKAQKDKDLSQKLGDRKALSELTRSVQRLSPELAKDFGEKIATYTKSSDLADKTKLKEILSIAKKAKNEAHPDIYIMTHVASIEYGLKPEQTRHLLDVVQDSEIVTLLNDLPPKTVGYLAENVVLLKDTQPDALKTKITKALSELSPIKQEQQELDESVAKFKKDNAAKKEKVIKVELPVKGDSKAPSSENQNTKKHKPKKKQRVKVKISAQKFTAEFRQRGINKKVKKTLDTSLCIKRSKAEGVSRGVSMSQTL